MRKRDLAKLHQVRELLVKALEAAESGTWYIEHKSDIKGMGQFASAFRLLYKAGDMLHAAFFREGSDTKWIREDSVAEACAMMLLNRASDIGSRTKVGKILGELAEDIRNGKWQDVE